MLPGYLAREPFRESVSPQPAAAPSTILSTRDKSTLAGSRKSTSIIMTSPNQRVTRSRYGVAGAGVAAGGGAGAGADGGAGAGAGDEAGCDTAAAAAFAFASAW